MHRRLAIIDLSERGAQPMRDDALGLTVVFNGCIYNHRELRAELERARARVRLDSATPRCCSRAGAQWGEGMLDRLAGMFAFCLLRGAQRARACSSATGSGIKPLYLAELPGGGLRAASTLPALRARPAASTRSVDPVALHHYLSWHSVVPAPRTILRGVAQARRRRRCWSSSPTARRRERRLLGPAVRARPGLGLVGGLAGRGARGAARRGAAADGRRRARSACCSRAGWTRSLIVALLAEQGQRGLATFSIGFPDAGGREGDEFEFSDLVAREFGTDHHQIRVGTRASSSRRCRRRSPR